MVAAAFAALVGLPVLRLKSDYLAIARSASPRSSAPSSSTTSSDRLTNGSNLLKTYPTFDTALFPFAVAGVCIAVI